MDEKEKAPKAANRSSAEIAADAFGKLALEDFHEFAMKIRGAPFGRVKMECLSEAMGAATERFGE